MLIPPEEVLRNIAAITKQYPKFLEWLDDNYMHELHNLPYQTEQLGRAQGRCQLYGELLKIFSKAPNSTVAKP